MPPTDPAADFALLEDTIIREAMRVGLIGPTLGRPLAAGMLVILVEELADHANRGLSAGEELVKLLNKGTLQEEPQLVAQLRGILAADTKPKGLARRGSAAKLLDLVRRLLDAGAELGIAEKLKTEVILGDIVARAKAKPGLDDEVAVLRYVLKALCECGRDRQFFDTHAALCEKILAREPKWVTAILESIRPHSGCNHDEEGPSL